MADLNKLLVKVPANLCDAFRTKYLTGDGSTPRDTSYDKKIVFLEDTKDIFSQGKIYGTSYADFTQLQNKVNERSVTLTFNVNSFDKINEQGGPGSNAELHYSAVSKAYENGGIVKIELDHTDFEISPENNNTKSAILSNIKKVPGIDAFGNNMTYFTGTLCSNSIDGVVGNSKSYDIKFKYISGDATYGRGYYVSCKEIADTLYNRKFGGGEIQGDTNGTFMEMIAPGNDTLSLVLKQLLTNDVLIKQSLEPVEIIFDNVRSFGEINLTYSGDSDPSDSHIADKYRQVSQAYTAGKVIKLTLRNPSSGLNESIAEPQSAILSNLEFKSWVDMYGNGHSVLKGLLSPYTSSKSFEIAFRSDISMNSGDEYSIYCKKLESFGSAAYQEIGYFVGEAKDEETKLTIHGTRKYAYNLANTAYNNAVNSAKDYTDSILPTVSAGNNINITETTVDGKVNYEIATTAKVFNYKGNKTTVEDLKKETTHSQGDVWSVGAANASGSSLYAWDGDEWINIGPADGVVGVNTNAKNGIGLTLNNGIVGISVTPGFIGTSDGFVTGEDINSALGRISNSLPGVEAGRGIGIDYASDANNKTTYTVATTSDIIRYLGSYYPDYPTSISDFKIGDAYSRKGVLYRCIGTYPEYANGKWEKIAGCFDTADTITYKNGIRFNFDPYVGELQLITKPGRIGLSYADPGYKDFDNFVNGATVYNYIKGLNGSQTSNNGTYVNVTVKTSGGNVSEVSVSETDNFTNLAKKLDSALQNVNILGKELTNTNNTLTVEEAKTKLGLGTAAYKAENYFDKAGAAAAVEKKLAGIINGSGITVTPGTPDANGKITYTISQSINTTAVNGVALKFVDSTNALGLSITTGKVSSSKFGDSANLVTGYDVYEALCTYTIKEVKTNPKNSTYITTAKRKYSDSAYSYSEISLNETAIYNYVIDNIWEEYSL